MLPLVACMPEFERKQIARQHLLNRNIDPDELEREQRPELMVPKLALVGMFNTLESFCAAGKTSVMSTIGSLNVRHLSMFLGALKKSIELGENILLEYQTAQAILQAKEQQDELDRLADLGEDEYGGISKNEQGDQEEEQTKSSNEQDKQAHEEEEIKELLKSFNIKKLN